MNIRVLKEALMLCREASVTAFIWGHAGIGKSTAVKDFANYITGRQHNNETPSCIDFRCAQMEASDIRGIPAAENGRTKYYIPSQFPTEDNNGVLFLDEINRAEDDVLHAIFELVLDRRVGEYRVPNSWSIVCAGNYNEGEYTVNAFNDFAFLDRFCHLELTIDQEYDRQWISHIKNKFNIESADKLTQFVASNTDRMLAKVDGNLGFSRRPTPRSWEAVMRVEKAYNKGFPIYENGKPKINNGKPERRPYDIQAYEKVVSGLVGGMLAREYFSFTAKILPETIAKEGVSKNKDILDDLGRSNLISLMWGVSAYGNKIIPKQEEKQAKNIMDFINYTATREKDLALMLIRGVLQDEISTKGSNLIVKNAAFAKTLERMTENSDSWINAFNKDKNISELIKIMNNDDDME